MSQTNLISLVGQDREQLAASLTAIGVSESQIRMRVNQLYHWIYERGVSDFDAMLNLSKSLRSDLKEKFTLGRPEIVEEQVSVDGTRKWLFRFTRSDGIDGQPIDVETVYIPEPERGTLCVSSQVGCSLTCTFCHTGTQKMVRNLTASEILAQVLAARDRLADHPDCEIDPEIIAPHTGRKVSNIVMMGMGEPLLNFENVKSALLIALDDTAMGFSRRRVTLSTSGVVPAIGKTASEIRCMLAISLHAVHDELRDELVPINRKYPLEQLLDACREYPDIANCRRITFEYVMLKDVNDSLEEARELVRLLRGIPAKINLIPFNPWPGSKYECSSKKQINRFANYLIDRGFESPVRTPRGRDIFAACGQLKSASEKPSKESRINANSKGNGIVELS